MRSASKNIEGFKDWQYSLTRHIRDPKNVSPPAGVEDRRLKIYRDLVYNGIEGFLNYSFPVLYKITKNTIWHAMVQDYVLSHQSHNPALIRMPLEFLQYLDNTRSNNPKYPDFILDLAYYEWSESSLFMDSREIDMTGIDVDGDLLAGVPALNPIIIAQTFSYPVYLISIDYVPIQRADEPCYLLMYRRKDDTVNYLELNAVSARLVDCMQANTDATGLQLLQKIAAELGHQNPQIVIDAGFEIMRQMHDRDILLGTQLR